MKEWNSNLRNGNLMKAVFLLLNIGRKWFYDLVHNVLKVEHRHGKSTTYKEVVELIGEPESIDTINGFVEYLLEEKYGHNIDPNGYKHLQLYFDKDSLLQNWMIVDTEFEP